MYWHKILARCWDVLKAEYIFTTSRWIDFTCKIVKCVYFAK